MGRRGAFAVGAVVVCLGLLGCRPVSGVRDDFDDNVVDAGLWGASYGQRAEAGGTAQVAATNLGFGGSAFRTDESYTLDPGGAAHVEVVRTATDAPRTSTRVSDTTATPVSTTTGNQLHIVYAVPSDGVDRKLDTNGVLRGFVEGWQRWLHRQTPGRVLKWSRASGQIVVSFARLPGTRAHYLDPVPTQQRYHESLAAIGADLKALGFTRPDRNYLVYCECRGVSTNGREVNGTGDINGIVFGDGRPTLGSSGRFASAFIERAPASELTDTSISNYWSKLGLHELLHALDAVQPQAPNYWQGDFAHVGQPFEDIMFQLQAPESQLVLDAGRDDYFGHGGTWLDVADQPFFTTAEPPVVLTGFALTATADVRDRWEIHRSGGVLVLREVVGGVVSDRLEQFDPSAHRWWRIANVAGRIEWQTSPDGRSWVTRRSAPRRLTGAVQVNLYAGSGGGVTAGSGAAFDDFNVTP
jgi:hypothetical protein